MSNTVEYKEINSQVTIIFYSPQYSFMGINDEDNNNKSQQQ